jgi:hypothetical protein
VQRSRQVQRQRGKVRKVSFDELNHGTSGHGGALSGWGRDRILG